MMHANDSAWIKMHARHTVYAIMHEHAHTACDPISVAGVSTDTFASANIGGENRLGVLQST